MLNWTVLNCEMDLLYREAKLQQVMVHTKTAIIVQVPRSDLGLEVVTAASL